MSATPSVPGPSFVAPEAPELAILRKALEWAKGRRLRVRPAAPPVICISSHAGVRWARRDVDSVIDPIGAAILMNQPDADEMPAAAAQALSTSEPRVHGLADGLAGEKPQSSWLMSAAKALYTGAYLAGLQLRVEMETFVCFAHGIRTPKGEHCSGCLQGLS